MKNLIKIHPKKIKSLIIIILLIPFLLFILPFILLIEFLNRNLKKYRLKIFCKKAAGKYFLVCTKRHNWYDFIVNNVIPTLPSNVELIWYKHNEYIFLENTCILLTNIPCVYGATKPLLLSVFFDHIKYAKMIIQGKKYGF